ncbi:putative ribonuclease H-like domain-containing protein [Tanacetum coccineum]
MLQLSLNGHFAKGLYSIGRIMMEGKRVTPFYQHQEAGKKEKNQMGLLTMDDGIVNWGEHTEDEETNHALMAISSNSEVIKKHKYFAYSQAVMKLEANLMAKPVWINDDRINHANQFVPRSVQLNTDRPNINSVRPLIIMTEYLQGTSTALVLKDQVACSGEMKGNMDQLEYLKNSMGICYLGGSKGYITGIGELSFDMRTPTPAKSFACLIAKATSDESRMWHMRIEILLVFCGNIGIKQEYQHYARTPQQNVVAERMNRTLIEAARTMLADSLLPTTFWAEAVSTACYIFNREKDEDAELIVVSSAVKNTAEKVEPMKSSTTSKKEEILTEPQHEKEASSTDTLEDNIKILAFRRELEEIALKNLGTVPENNSTSTPSVNSGELKRFSKLYKMTVGFKQCKMEMLQFKHATRYRVLVDLPQGMKVISTKWVYKNKRDERGVVVKNKARLVASGYSQMRVLDYDEVLLLWQNEVIDEEVYVLQPPGFVDLDNPKKVYKVVKALYGLHQAPRACVKTAINSQLETKVALTKVEEAVDVDVTPKTSHLNAMKRIFKYLKGKPNLGLWYPRESPFDLEAFSDSDYVGSNLDRKSTTGGCQFLRQSCSFFVQIMAQLKYCDKHNQVGFLLKPDESAGFAEIVDFLRGSNLRYALTTNPTIHGSLVKQFWQTATAKTLADGTLELHATIDTIAYTITDACIRSKLKLADASGITMLPKM